MYIVIRFGDW